MPIFECIKIAAPTYTNGHGYGMLNDVENDENHLFEFIDVPNESVSNNFVV